MANSTATAGAVNVICQRPGVIKKNAWNNCLGFKDAPRKITFVMHPCHWFF
jgi:hypothetical protein